MKDKEKYYVYCQVCKCLICEPTKDINKAIYYDNIHNKGREYNHHITAGTNDYFKRYYNIDCTKLKTD